jgi:hypothetical protein
MHTRLPPFAVALGIAGLVPFIGCGIAAVSTADTQAVPAFAALIAYGAVILAFLGGVHWGFVLAPQPDSDVAASAPARLAQPNLRLLLGVLPSLIGWAALLTLQFAAPAIALAILIIGFLATVIAEWQMRRRAVIPTGYMWLRWGLSLVVLVTLITVMALHLLGAKIIL